MAQLHQRNSLVWRKTLSCCTSQKLHWEPNLSLSQFMHLRFRRFVFAFLAHCQMWKVRQNQGFWLKFLGEPCPSCWATVDSWFTNPAFTSWGCLFIPSFTRRQRELYIPGGCLGFLKHQQYDSSKFNIEKMIFRPLVQKLSTSQHVQKFQVEFDVNFDVFFWVFSFRGGCFKVQVKGRSQRYPWMCLKLSKINSSGSHTWGSSLEHIQ